MSTVFCVVPTHNRLARLTQCVDYLKAQTHRAIRIVIVDDGSTDGTKEFLRTEPAPNLTVLEGDGNLWWSGAINSAMRFVLANCAESDYLLMLNDDVRFGPGYISALLAKSQENPRAVVGSVQCDDVSGDMLSCGISINFTAMTIAPLAECDEKSVYAFPGRGVLYSIVIIKKIGLINSRLFPQYYADIEYSARAKDKGFALVVSVDAKTFSEKRSSDQSTREKGAIARWFSFRSKDNLLQRLIFFSIRGPVWLRFWALPRYLFVAPIRRLGGSER